METLEQIFQAVSLVTVIGILLAANGFLLFAVYQIWRRKEKWKI